MTISRNKFQAMTAEAVAAMVLMTSPCAAQASQNNQPDQSATTAPTTVKDVFNRIMGDLSGSNGSHLLSTSLSDELQNEVPVNAFEILTQIGNGYSLTACGTSEKKVWDDINGAWTQLKELEGHKNPYPSLAETVMNNIKSRAELNLPVPPSVPINFSSRQSFLKCQFYGDSPQLSKLVGEDLTHGQILDDLTSPNLLGVSFYKIPNPLGGDAPVYMEVVLSSNGAGGYNLRLIGTTEKSFFDREVKVWDDNSDRLNPDASMAQRVMEQMDNENLAAARARKPIPFEMKTERPFINFQTKEFIAYQTINGVDKPAFNDLVRRVLSASAPLAPVPPRTVPIHRTLSPT